MGAWVYDDYNILVSIYQDGACEVSWDNGTCNSGACQMEGGARFTLSGDGGIVEDDGHAMYPGQVPDDLSGPLNGR